MPLPDWRERPTLIEALPRSIKHALFIDEYGDHNFKYVDYCIRNSVSPTEADRRYLGLCGAIFHMDNHEQAKQRVVNLKNAHWPPDGRHIQAIPHAGQPCRVCLHATEIKRSKGAFSKSIVNQAALMSDIGDIMQNISFTLVACVVDKYEFSRRYNHFRPAPYSKAAELMLERFVFEINKFHEKAVVILESRGRKEDAEVLSYLTRIIENGNQFAGGRRFQNIVGIYFNPKRTCDNQKSYVGLEIADLCCGPMVRAAINPQQYNRAYEAIKEKIRGYPDHISGIGIKLIP